MPGSGLGLALVRRIIELHGGRVEVHSRPEQGTMVRVNLPNSPN
jgi:signal transduction histidine kinase